MPCPSLAARLSVLFSLATSLAAATARAQTAPTTPAPAVPVAAAAPATTAAPTPPATGSADTLPPPETQTLTTKDGVQLVFTYLPGTRGKDTVPIILLHMFKGNRHEMQGLGMFLQAKGHACILPDLRGHGDSTTVVGVDRRLDAATMPVAQFTNMITQDMESVKKFIVNEHNAAKLNVDKLCVVGAEMSVQIAVNWAASDWAAQDLPTLKQSKDVKALVLLSPTMSFKNLSLAKALAFEPIRDKVSFLIIAGAEDHTSVADARRIVQGLDKFRPKPTRIEDKTVFLEDTLKTKLVGSKLLGEKSLGVEELIGEFVELRLGANAILPWKERIAP
jgi:pimeloyl-ACP methyl ester carboxylesterase